MPNTTTILQVEGMSCNHCVNSIKNAIGALKGVESVEVDLEQKKVTVNYNEGLVSIQTIKETIEDQGYAIIRS